MASDGRVLIAVSLELWASAAQRIVKPTAPWSFSDHSVHARRPTTPRLTHNVNNNIGEIERKRECKEKGRKINIGSTKERKKIISW